MKKLLRPAVITAITVLLVGGIYWYLDKNDSQKTGGVDVQAARDIVLEQLEEGIDYSNSLYDEEDRKLINEKLEEQKRMIVEKGSLNEQQIYGIASWFVTSNDYDGALRLYDAADLYGGTDLSYRVRRAYVNRRKGNLDAARAELELLRTEWPIPETYLELAEVYKQIPDTPDYVVDDIYKEGLEKQVTQRSDLLLALIDWMEETERPALSIPYIEEYLTVAPDPELEQKLIKLKAQTN